MCPLFWMQYHQNWPDPRVFTLLTASYSSNCSVKRSFQSAHQYSFFQTAHPCSLFQTSITLVLSRHTDETNVRNPLSGETSPTLPSWNLPSQKTEDYFSQWELFRCSLRWLRRTARQIGRMCDHPILVGCTAVRLEEYFPTFSKHRSAFIFRVQCQIPDGLYLQQNRYNKLQFRINGLNSDQIIFKAAKRKKKQRCYWILMLVGKCLANTFSPKIPNRLCGPASLPFNVKWGSFCGKAAGM